MKTKSVSLPAPIGGWNARDALAQMKPSDAVALVNWFPTPSMVQSRPGYKAWATGMTGQVNAVMAYNGPATSKLFAAVGSNIYDVTAGGAVGAAAVSGLASSYWMHTNMATAGGNFLVCANGTDSILEYDGTNWKTITGSSTPAITGVATTSLTHPYVAKQRLWFIEINSLRAWYLPVQSIAGAASALDFGSLCRRGGYLVSMAEWTIQGGFGVQDLVVFVTSEGEVLIYQGSDPSNANNWSLVGIWHMGSPMGRKCFCKFGQDLLLLGKEGLTPLSQGQFFADVGNKGTLTDKIQWAISQVTTAYANNYGWQVIPYPLGNALLLNVPVAAGQQQQYVMNTITGAWCSFTGWNANCWDMLHDQIYFGENGRVCLAWYGYDDDGKQITFDAQQAYNYFDSRGQLKRFTMMRPIVSSNGTPAIYANINVDFDDTEPIPVLTYSGVSGSKWDVDKWDTAIWGGFNKIMRQWQGVNGVGYCGAPRLLCAATGIGVQWMSTDLVMDLGAVL